MMVMHVARARATSFAGGAVTSVYFHVCRHVIHQSIQSGILAASVVIQFTPPEHPKRANATDAFYHQSTTEWGVVF
jgi:hypothetical protein